MLCFKIRISWLNFYKDTKQTKGICKKLLARLCRYMQQEWDQQLKFGISFSKREKPLQKSHQKVRFGQLPREKYSHSVGDTLCWEVLTLWALSLLLPKDFDLLWFWARSVDVGWQLLPAFGSCRSLSAPSPFLRAWGWEEEPQAQ